MRLPDRLTENRFIEQLVQMRRYLDELKQSRQLFGSDSIEVGLRQSANTWDVNGASIADFSDKQYRVTFTPNSGKNIYATLSFLQTIDNATFFEKVEAYPDPAASSNDTKRVWIVSVSTSTNPITLYLKFFVEAVDDGTISVVPI